MYFQRASFAELGQRYRGKTAVDYDSRRGRSTKWCREQETVERLLSRLVDGATLLDVPVGTGRFFDFYRRYGLIATGIDISADMLAQAKRKAAQLRLPVTLIQGDIRRIDTGDDAFDVVMCIRFLNWIDGGTLETVVGELTRIARHELILGIRTYLPRDELRPLSLRGLRSFLYRQLCRIRQAKSPKLFVHERQFVLDLFARHGLRTVSATLVDLHLNGTTYNIYVLEKAS